MNFEEFDKLYGPNGWIRKQVLQRVEQLRESKVIGKSVEVGVSIVYRGQNESDCCWENDLIRTSLNVSWIQLSYQYENNNSLQFDCSAWDLKGDPDFKQCPRCFLFYLYRYSDGFIKVNYDDLCDRCMGVMLSCYPDHPAMEAYIKKYPKYFK